MIAFANGSGGKLFVGINNDREAFGITLDLIDETKNLISIFNDRYIFPHIKYKFSMHSVDDDASKFVLAINGFESDSIVRWREGDFNESVFIKGDGNALPANLENIISLAKRKYGVDKSIAEIKYDPLN